MVNALLRFSVATVAEHEYATVYCEMIAEVSGVGELDVYSVSFNSSEDNGFTKLAPMVGWVEAGSDFDIRIDCETFTEPNTFGVGMDTGSLVAARYGVVHTPPEPPPSD